MTSFFLKSFFFFHSHLAHEKKYDHSSSPRINPRKKMAKIPFRKEDLGTDCKKKWIENRSSIYPSEITQTFHTRSF